MRELLDDRTKNPTDAIQQGLGKPFSLRGGKVNQERLNEASGLPLPFEEDREPDFCVLGIDQGRYANWAMVQHWYLADTNDKHLKWKNAHKSIVWYGKITFAEIDDLVEKWSVDIVAMDSEPDYNLVSNYALDHVPTSTSFYAKEQGVKGVVYLMDQLSPVTMKTTQYKCTERPLQDTEDREDDTLVLIFNINRTYWLDQVRDRIYRGHTHLPPGLEYDPSNDSNLFKHYLTSERFTDGTWKEAEGEPDHWFHADSFCEAAMVIGFYEEGVSSSGFFFTSI